MTSPWSGDVGDSTRARLGGPAPGPGPGGEGAEQLHTLPHGVVAHGWIPFVAVTVVALVFSVLYVIWYVQQTTKREKSLRDTLHNR